LKFFSTICQRDWDLTPLFCLWPQLKHNIGSTQTLHRCLGPKKWGETKAKDSIKITTACIFVATTHWPPIDDR